MDFKNVNREIERWLETNAANCPRDAEVIEIGKYGKAERIVVEQFYRAKAFRPLVEWQLGMNVVGDYESPKLHALSDALVAEDEVVLLKRLWAGVLAKRRAAYWSNWSYRNKLDNFEATIEKSRRHVINGFDHFLKALDALDARDERAAVARQRERFALGDQTKLMTKPDPRKIDGALFWQLIAECSAADSTDGKIELLTERLAEFSGPDIKRFGSLLEQELRKLYRYDVWALAFIAQQGCSDDSFEEFRAWLVLQGEEAVAAIASDVNRAVGIVPDGLETQAGNLLHAPAVAYELRTGKPLLVARKDVAKPKGKRWEEEDLHSLFPVLWDHFEAWRSI